MSPDWAEALAPVAATIAAMGDFLRAELAAGPQLSAGRAATCCAPSAARWRDVGCLIVGQDPYPTPGHPVGLSFSVAPDVRPIPRSLQNIYAELQRRPGHSAGRVAGDLTPWFDQGCCC